VVGFKKYSRSFIAVSFLLTAGLSAVLRWDWSAINVYAIDFPQSFIFGVGTSSYQVEGDCTNNQWCEHECTTCDENGALHMPEPSGKACDHWNRYKEDVQLIKNINANAYRLSIEWSKVEPQEGVFDEAALQHYVDVCDALRAKGIKIMITIYHYTIPIWFARKGGFEKEQNIKDYVRFAAKMFETLHDKVDLWLTFNSPVGYALPSYYQGLKPPYKKNMKLAIEVLKNVLEAHVQAYKKLKSMPGGQQSRIGILKNIYQLDPVSKWDILARLWAYMGNKVANKTVYRFFTTGTFSVNIPFKIHVKHKNMDAPQSLDFIGLSYYSHAGVKGTKIAAYPGETATLNKRYTIYPEGFYRAIKELSNKVAKKLNIPIYVTENGIAAVQEQDRDLFLKRYIYAMSQAIADGHDVRGYFHWSLMDNYEWGKYTKRYGLYHVDFGTQKRTLKPSAQHFVDVATEFATA